MNGKIKKTIFDNIKIKKVNLPTNLLTSRYIVPPFTILDTKAGYWQERRNIWKHLGIKSELGRGDNLTFGLGCFKYDDEKERREHLKNTIANFQVYRDRKNKEAEEANKTLIKSKFGKCLPDSIGEKYGRNVQATSIFDPVLTEIMYRWFSRDGDKILDPFAGGSVRGVVAACLGRHYTGMDLSEIQIEANKIQFKDINEKYCDVNGTANWICGDSLTIKEKAPGEYNMIMSCPPYYDLEVYSDKPEDISNMGTYEEFLQTYRTIIKNSCDMLVDNSFAVFVVSDIRDKKTGYYRGFVGDTIKAFEDAGLHYYNEAILVNTVGTLPVRIGKQFNSGRKMGRQHQNVLVFYKGDASKIKEKFGEIEVGE